MKGRHAHTMNSIIITFNNCVRMSSRVEGNPARRTAGHLSRVGIRSYICFLLCFLSPTPCLEFFCSPSVSLTLSQTVLVSFFNWYKDYTLHVKNECSPTSKTDNTGLPFAQAKTWGIIVLCPGCCFVPPTSMKIHQNLMTPLLPHAPSISG